MSKALLEVTYYSNDDHTFHSVNILDHTDKIIIKVLNIDKTYDENNNTIMEYHNSTLQLCTQDQFYN